MNVYQQFGLNPADPSLVLAIELRKKQATLPAGSPEHLLGGRSTTRHSRCSAL